MAIKKPLVINNGIISHVEDDSYLEFKNEEIENLQERTGDVETKLTEVRDEVSGLTDAFGQAIIS